MDQTVVGMFDTSSQAQQAAQKLAAAGFGLEGVDVSNARDTTSDAKHQRSASTTAEQANDGISGFFNSLFGGDDSDDTAQRYGHVARSTGSIVAVHCQSAEHAHKAAKILDEAGAVDVNERAAATGYQAAGKASNATNANAAADGMTAEIIEEKLQVGKRVEQTGGVRLRSRIVERPVEASVRLREEHVVVNRIPVDRPATNADFNTFKEGQVEVTESAERAVVGKQAHVVEEVSLGKQVTEREETIHETVRKTEVDVEKIPGSTTAGNNTAGNKQK